MSATVTFAGYPGLDPDDTHTSYPYGWSWHEGDSKFFDAYLAQTVGRPDDNDGSDFAELFVATENDLFKWLPEDKRPFSFSPVDRTENAPPEDDAPEEDAPPTLLSALTDYHPMPPTDGAGE